MKYATLLLISLVWVSGSTTIFCQPAAGQAQLLVAFDFEGEVGNAFATDKSNFGTQLDALLFSDASIINDPERGAVLQTGAAGLGAATLHDDKLEVSQSYTLSAWIKTSSTGIFEHVIGRAGVGPRIMNHWGLGAVSFVQMIDNINGFPFPDFGDEVVNFGPGGPPGGDGEWHHVLVSWNHDTREFWGYFDGETGISADNGLMTSRQTVVTHEGPPGLAFQIAGDPNTSGGRLRNSMLDDVAFWKGYATQEVAQGLFDGTYTIYNAPIVFPGPPTLLAADFDLNGTVDGADLTLWKAGFGTVASATRMQGDADSDGDVDGSDFLIWQQQFGNVPAIGAAAQAPEPAALLLATVGMMVIGLKRRNLPQERGNG